MHELSVCQALIDEVSAVAMRRRAVEVTDVFVSLGPLSGVEGPLLSHAFPLAAAGSVASGATLHIENRPVRVRCLSCGLESGASANRLVCAACGDWRTDVVSGDEMHLERVVMTSESHV